MKVLETRTDKLGIVYRRYCDGRRRVTTYELPATVVKGLGVKRVREAMGAWQRGEAARDKARHLRAFVAAHPDWKTTAIAHEMGVTDQRVRQVRKELSDR